MRFVDQIESRLSPSTAKAYSKCVSFTPAPQAELQERSAKYLAQLEQSNSNTEFLDIDTARKVATGCDALIAGLSNPCDVAHHRAVHAAVEYFILEDDGEDDSSVIGFDDDWQVVEVTAKVLGWGLEPSQ
ncbi:MAG: hypothetical protein JKY61_12515 [Planctomycetes bacterium]|nr:hypothetical protein [Planctomycetota bacterium]